MLASIKETGMDGTDPPLHPCPGPPPGFPLLSPHLKDKTQPIPISSFLLNLGLSHPRNPESYLFSSIYLPSLPLYLSLPLLGYPLFNIYISASSLLLSPRYPHVSLPNLIPRLYFNPTNQIIHSQHTCIHLVYHLNCCDSKTSAIQYLPEYKISEPFENFDFHDIIVDDSVGDRTYAIQQNIINT
jgi:hypothetical protein